jgi:uncharacterized membrane protein SpoIIM required for sporulation
MFKSENFIYFLSVSGFFIGLIFATIQELEPFEFLWAVIIIFTIFYMIAVASTGFFIKYLGVKNIFYLDKENLEKTIDMQIDELDKKEEIIREAFYFIRNLEQEELDIYKNKENKK